MDTSTPVRNVASTSYSNISESILNDDDESSAEHCVFHSKTDDSFEQINQLEPKSTPNITDLDKSTELFPFSPIPHPKNVPHSLLPLLDTPNLKWSDSILTPYELYQQGGTPSQLVPINTVNTNKSIESAAYTPSSFHAYSENKSVDESSPLKYSDSVRQILSKLCSPVVDSHRKSTSKKIENNKCINKKLFPIAEEESIKNDISYQRLGDITLDAIEQICQISETLYSNSPVAGSSKTTTNDSCVSSSLKTERSRSIDISFSDSELNNGEANFTSQSPLGSTDDFEQSNRSRRKFVYPYKRIKKPVDTIPMNEVIESVLSLEECKPIWVSKCKPPIPRALVSFSKLIDSENDEENSMESSCILTESRDSIVPIRKTNAHPYLITCRNKDVLDALKSFFSICRVDFARSKDLFVNCKSIGSQLSLFCEERFIVRLNEELVILRQKVRKRIVNEFFDFFRCNFNLVYNNSKLARNVLCIYSDRQRRKCGAKKTRKIHSKMEVASANNSAQTLLSNNLIVPKSEENNCRRESLISVQQLLADVQDSDFEFDPEFHQTLNKSSNSLLFNCKKQELSSELMLPNSTCHRVEAKKICCDGKSETGQHFLPKSLQMKNENSLEDLLMCEASNDFYDFNQDKPTPTSNEKSTSNIFSDIVDFDLSEFSPCVKNALPCFSTANGSKINFQAASLARGHKMLQNVSKEVTMEHSDNDAKDNDEKKSIEFNTAAGRKIKVSEEKLAYAQKLMEPVIQEFSDDMEFLLFDEKQLGLADVPESVPEKWSSAPNNFAFDSSVRKRPLQSVLLDENKTDTGKRTKYENFTGVELANNLSGIGFSTAGGRKIAVNDESLINAKKILENISEDIVDGQENFAKLERKGELGSFNDSSNKVCNKMREILSTSILNPQKCHITAQSCEKITRKYENSTEKTLQEVEVSRKVAGFETASGSKINVANSALKRAEKMFRNVDNEIRKESVGFQTASGSKINVAESALNKAGKIFRNIDEEITKDFVGVATASKNEIDVSEIDLDKSEKICHNEGDKMNEETFERSTSPEISLKSNRAANQRRKKLLKSILNEEMLSICEFSNKSVGFSTASGNKINVSNSALKNAEKLLQDMETDPSLSYEISLESSPKILKNVEEKYIPMDFSRNLIQFETASGREIKVSESALKKADSFLKSLTEETTQSTSSSKFLESKLGKKAVDLDEREVSPSKINVTEDSSEKFEKLSSNVDGTVFERETSPEILSTSKHGRRTRDPARKKNEISLPSVGSSGKFIGFETASGENIGVSELRLKKAEKLFQDVDNDLIKEAHEINLGISADSNKQQSILSEHFPENHRNTLPSLQTKKEFIGFETASGKNIGVSELRLKNAKKLFQDVDNELNKEAREIDLKISADSNEQQSIFPEHFLENHRNTPSSPQTKKKFIGFETASGKNVGVSELRLKNAKKLFQEVNNELNNEACEINLGINTDSNKQQFSFPGDFSENHRNTLPSIQTEKEFIGFKTATGNKMKPSESALKKAEKLFQSLHDDLVFTQECTSANDEPALVEDSNQVTKFSGIEEIGKFYPFERTSNNSTEAFALAGARKNKGLETSSGVEAFIKEPVKLFQPIEEDQMKNSIEDNARKVLESSNMVPSEFDNSKMISENEQKERSSEFIENQDPSCFHSTITENLVEMKEDDVDETNISSIPNESPVIGDSVQQSRISRNSTTLVQDQTNKTPTKEKSNLQSRSSSPVFETRKSNQPKKRMKRRSQACSLNLNLTPLDVTYNRKEGENSCSVKCSPEDMFKIIKSNFSQSSHKRKETASSMVYPTSKKTKESCISFSSLRIAAVAEQQKYVENKSKEDCKPKIGSYLMKQKNEKKISMSRAVNGLKPGRYSAEKLIQLGLKPEVVAVDAENASQFVFVLENYERKLSIICGDECAIILGEKNEVHFEDLARGFLASPGVDPKLISEAWIRNHYRWIVWKLAAFEKSYPQLFAKKYLTIDNVLRQLKYRYDREIDLCERSALKRIIECDDSPSKPMVLCVVSIKSIANTLNEFELELTDGWYKIRCQLDMKMCELITKKKISVGCKLLITNAELIGLQEGCDPLEVTDDVRLKMFTNSTRLARWDTRLGFYAGTAPVIRNLKAVLPNGGVSYAIMAVIARIYPLLYMEKKSGKYSELYNEKVEFKRASKFDRERQASLEQLASVVTREVEREQGVDENDEYNSQEMGVDMVSAQKQRFIDQERLQSLIRERIESRIPEQFRTRRKVLCLLKMRIVDDELNENTSSAIVTIWQPSEDLMSLLKEGKLYVFHNLNANDTRNQELQLTSNRATKYELQSVLPKSNFHQRRYTAISELKTDFVSLFSEMDTVGVVIDKRTKDQSSGFDQRIIYLADLEQNIIAVEFRSNFEDYGFEDILKRKNIVAAINLQWKQKLLCWKIPKTFVIEYTKFTQKSKYQHLQSRLSEFESFFKIQNLDMFIEQCEKKLESLMESTCPAPAATSTPIRKTAPVNVSDCSSVCAKSDSSINLSGNCDKSIKSKDVQSRIDRLRRYGEPPPLSPIMLTNTRTRRARLSIQTSSFRSNDSKS